MKARRLLAIGSLVAVGGALAIAGIANVANGPADPRNPPVSAVGSDTTDIAEVQAAAAEAIFTAEQLGLPESQWSTSAVAAVPPTGMLPQKAPTAPTPAQLHALRDAYAQRLSRVFAHAPETLHREMSGLDNVIDSLQSPHSLFFGSGVSRLSFESTTVSQDTATVVAKAEIWSHFAQLDPAGNVHEALPVATVTWTWELAKFDGAWAVTDGKWSYDAGSEP